MFQFNKNVLRVENKTMALFLISNAVEVVLDSSNPLQTYQDLLAASQEDQSIPTDIEVYERYENHFPSDLIEEILYIANQNAELVNTLISAGSSIKLHSCHKCNAPINLKSESISDGYDGECVYCDEDMFESEWKEFLFKSTCSNQ
ncbi:hypothetical protein HC723_16415 [Vibrio sp. S11_S32]|uniref:hypothetical protein n=1 Tax=Vibrio sp. S11_S32 TaxID=2720225 RepID=UPI0016809813|nr:hypothetical protein [Vibrio sp. S11_S32]MBD1577974.1 hypothetical protein [Vibrio sp. S11_S32]